MCAHLLSWYSNYDVFTTFDIVNEKGSECCILDGFVPFAFDSKNHLSQFLQ